MYSQRDEEKVILEHLGSTGRFLDVGAYSFKFFSNTRALAERGWRGVLVEPCPDACNNLIQETKDVPGIEIVNAVVTPDHEGLVKFYASPNALSTLDENHVKKWLSHPGVSFRPIWTTTLSVGRLLTALPGPYQFISIDCEGVSFEILKALDLRALDCELVCIEMDQQAVAIINCLMTQGYSVFHKTEENLIAKRDS